MSVAGKSNPLAISGLVVLTLIWSYSWIFMKQVTSYIGAFDFTALRCIFGALVLFIVLLLRGRGMRPTPFKYTLAIALLQTCGMVGLAQWALVSGGAGKVAILSYTMPFWVVIFAALFLGERLRRGQYFAILIAAFGLFLVLQPWQLDFSSMKSAMLAILSGVSWGASAIVAKRLYARHPRVDLLSLTSWQMLYAALVMSVVALLVISPEEPPSLSVLKDPMLMAIVWFASEPTCKSVLPREPSNRVCPLNDVVVAIRSNSFLSC